MVEIPVRITFGMLLDTVSKFPREELQWSRETVIFYLALAVLKHFFNEDWLLRHLERSKYLRIVDDGDQTQLDLSALRIIDLAEVIFNLQHVENFDNCIARMRDGDIDGTAAELDLGRMLYLNHVQFRYMIPQGIKGKDYDVEIILPDGLVCCADAKCALESTQLDAKAIYNKLEKARKQLPADRPSIIFIKMPPHWMDNEAFAATTVNEARSLFARTERIVSVKFYVATTTFAGEYARERYAFKELSNPKTRFAARDWELFRPLNLPPEMQGMPAHWQQLRSLVISS